MVIKYWNYGRGYHLDGTGFVYRAVVESNSSEFYEIYLNNYANKIHLVSRFDEIPRFS